MRGSYNSADRTSLHSQLTLWGCARCRAEHNSLGSWNLGSAIQVQQETSGPVLSRTGFLARGPGACRVPREENGLERPGKVCVPCSPLGPKLRPILGPLPAAGSLETIRGSKRGLRPCEAGSLSKPAGLWLSCKEGVRRQKHVRRRPMSPCVL